MPDRLCCALVGLLALSSCTFTSPPITALQAEQGAAKLYVCDTTLQAASQADHHIAVALSIRHTSATCPITPFQTAQPAVAAWLNSRIGVPLTPLHHTISVLAGTQPVLAKMDLYQLVSSSSQTSASAHSASHFGSVLDRSLSMKGSSDRCMFRSNNEIRANLSYLQPECLVLFRCFCQIRSKMSSPPSGSRLPVPLVASTLAIKAFVLGLVDVRHHPPYLFS